MKILPISIAQTRFLNPINLLKALLWYFFRSFQINNNHKYRSLFLGDDNIEIIKKLYIPKEIKIISKPDKDSIILISKFNLYLLIKNIKNFKSIRIVDKNFFLTSEASTRLRLFYYDFLSPEEKQEYKNLSIKNFNSLQIPLSDQVIGLLGTGPSYNEAKDIFLKNKFNIISCNSSIYDDELWERDCKILCFADPVFHFGNSNEANRFKTAVINRFRLKKFHIVCPISAVPILINIWNLDERYIIGIDSLSKNNDNRALTANNTSNVLTEFMLPTASLITKEIYLGGFDGRDSSEKNFWKYSDQTHQTLDEHIENHPSFFNDRNISKYYNKHLTILKNQIVNLEKSNYKIINVTKSYIPVLNQRYRNE
ncbi:MAG: hypothetical protein CMC31_05910 [Flavobacteriaceae bacterium]|nr:hypothetical protein [Flavobacteriaceae bacterium]